MNISYATERGSLRNLTEMERLAEPGEDFKSAVGFIILPDGMATISIPIEIVDVSIIVIIIIHYQYGMLYSK